MRKPLEKFLSPIHLLKQALTLAVLDWTLATPSTAPTLGWVRFQKHYEWCRLSKKYSFVIILFFTFIGQSAYYRMVKIRIPEISSSTWHWNLRIKIWVKDILHMCYCVMCHWAMIISDDIMFKSLDKEPICFSDLVL